MQHDVYSVWPADTEAVANLSLSISYTVVTFIAELSSSIVYTFMTSNIVGTASAQWSCAT